MEVIQKIKTMMFGMFGLNEEQLTEVARFNEDLGMDSLQITELIMEIEDEFKIEISDEEAECFSADLDFGQLGVSATGRKAKGTFAELVSLVQTKVAAKTA